MPIFHFLYFLTFGKIVYSFRPNSMCERDNCNDKMNVKTHSLLMRSTAKSALLRLKSGLLGNKIDSQSKRCGFGPCFIQNTRWKWCQGHVRINFCTQFCQELLMIKIRYPERGKPKQLTKLDKSIKPRVLQSFSLLNQVLTTRLKTKTNLPC